MKKRAVLVPALLLSSSALACSSAHEAFEAPLEHTDTTAEALEDSATWQQGGGSSQHASVNGYDTTIDAAKVPTLINYWTYPASYPTNPAVVGGRAYTGAADGTVMAIDPFDGRVVWSRTLPSGVHYSPAVSYGRVFVTADHTLYALSTTSGSIVSQVDHAGAVWASAPLVIDGKVFVRDDAGTISAYDARATGTPSPLFTFAVSASADPTAGGGKIYVPSTDGRIYAFASSGCVGTCTPLWSSAPLPRPATFPAALWSGRLVVTMDDPGTAVALDASTGAPVWSTALGGSTATTGPAVAYGLVMVSVVAPNELWALSLATGALVWRSPLAADATDTPSVANRLVYVPSGRTVGHLEVFDTRCGTGGATCAPVTDFGGDPFGYTPSIAGGRIFSGAATGLRVLALPPGQ